MPIAASAWQKRHKSTLFLWAFQKKIKNFVEGAALSEFLLTFATSFASWTLRAYVNSTVFFAHLRARA